MRRKKFLYFVSCGDLALKIPLELKVLKFLKITLEMLPFKYIIGLEKTRSQIVNSSFNPIILTCGYF